ncbi:MAG: proline--tRNA ligase [Parcubacteria group bacterium]|nr:proline--tRNA ligase [Parcubacteria group bacterium]
MALPSKSKSLSDWYQAVVINAELADYAPVKGMMVIRPNGYALWEEIQATLNPFMRDAGVANAYFPLLIPKSFLDREAKHVAGFAPELAVVTIAGGEKLAEPLVVRPTSETIMYAMFAKWIESWRDLPLKLNQWNNVVRWEKRTYLFLRTTEFLWQEGHTAHETHDEALAEQKRALSMYLTLYREYLALAGIAGIKSKSETFAGATTTFTYELVMPDGKILQAATSHDLGQRFGEAFGIRFQTRDGNEGVPWQTSWGLSTRAIGALVLGHGDDRGLILPSRIAPCEVIVIPIFTNDDSRDSMILREALKLTRSFPARWNARLDDRREVSPGAKFYEWELKGVPLRIEYGARELAAAVVTMVRRDNQSKTQVAMSQLSEVMQATLENIQQELFLQSERLLASHTHEIATFKEFTEIMEGPRGFIRAFWCEEEACERAIKEATHATVRCLPFEALPESGKCVYCGTNARYRWYFGQSY